MQVKPMCQAPDPSKAPGIATMNASKVANQSQRTPLRRKKHQTRATGTVTATRTTGGPDAVKAMTSASISSRAQRATTERGTRRHSITSTSFLDSSA